MDIRFAGAYPGNLLSNLAAHKFTFDGVECGSFEGFIQSLTIEDEEERLQVCKLSGMSAKLKGQEWERNQTLYWKDKTYYRLSDDYQQLLDRAYNALYEQSETFRDALDATGKATLTHKIGNNKESQTILTQNEFTSRLTKLRDFKKL